MRYYLDTEFNGHGGELISLALIRDDLNSLYVVRGYIKDMVPWVRENVVPHLGNVPAPILPCYFNGAGTLASLIREFLRGDTDPVIITDWPEDIALFCRAILTGPGTMIPVPGLKFEMIREDAYPTTLEGAVQHNAWWDAMALRQKLIEVQKGE